VEEEEEYEAMDLSSIIKALSKKKVTKDQQLLDMMRD